MRTSFVLGMLATSLMAGSTLMHVSALAVPVETAHGIRADADSLKLVESVQYVWGGLPYCWYDDGWQGPRMVRVQLWSLGVWQVVGRRLRLASLAWGTSRR
jgi:hypothetical protein